MCWQENFPCSSAGKESACNAGDPGSTPESGRSSGEGIGYPLQYSWTSLVVDLATCNAGDLGLIPGSGRSQLSGNCRQKRKKSGCFFSDPSLAGCLREQVCSSMTIQRLQRSPLSGPLPLSLCETHFSSCYFSPMLSLLKSGVITSHCCWSAIVSTSILFSLTSPHMSINPTVRIPLTSRNRDTDVEDKHMDTKEEWAGDELGDSD